MPRALRDLDVVVLDCQASGATPELGALLEIGWRLTSLREGIDPKSAAVVSHFVAPPEGHRVPPFVQKLLGWSRKCLETALDPSAAWRALLEVLPSRPAPTVIHYASFELPFLRDLHSRFGDGDPFPLEIVCLHAVARRLFPDLPRRSLRALSGFLGHSPDLLRRSSGHVEASAFVWRALLPVLEREGVSTWEDLGRWLEGPAPKRTGKIYPMPAEKRRALPDAPGVYRFVRSNGDILYVGKATSLRKRVTSHFASAKKPERSLEMLTQALDVLVTPTATALEAALLETDEIKRLDPPYNVHLREGDRQAWFASPDLSAVAPRPDRDFRLGPLPSEASLSEFATIGALVCGAAATSTRRADAVGAPPQFTPPADLFDEVWPEFVRAHRLERGHRRGPWPSMMRAARALFAIRGTLESPDDDSTTFRWDRERIRRHLDRSLLRGGHLVRRARWLCALADSAIVFREASSDRHRLLFLENADIAEPRDASESTALPTPARRAVHERRAAFDATRYDRVRTLATELERVHSEGGLVRIRIGDKILEGERLARVLRWS